jgi:signal transduction histidine kinase
MIGAYIITLVVCLAVANIFVYETLETRYINAKKDVLLAHSKNVIDSAIEKDTGSAARLRKAVEMASIRADAQVILVNKNMTIVDDSYHRLVYTQYEGPMDITPVFYPGKEISAEYIINGDRKLYIALPIEGDTDVAQAVVMYCSLSDIYDEVYSICRDLIVISGFLVVIFAFFSVIVFSRITHPIRKVNNAITSMAEGNLDQHVDAKGNDEIASLCNSFNNMNRKIIAVDEQRRQFVADASHELKSPLASIKVLVQSLLAGGIDNRDISVEFLQDVDQEVDRLSDIVGSLLELTKLEGSYGMKFERFNIAILCKEVISKLNFIAKTKNIKIESELRDFVIEGNRENIFRAVYNIVENAIKYSPKGGKVFLEINGDDFVRISIKDQGVGIPEDEIGKIFQRFYRVDKTRARKTGGSGLGLSIVMEIIKQHKGNIEVKSKVGEGSLFIISLPYKFQS